MKKTLIFVALATLAAAVSCSKEIAKETETPAAEAHAVTLGVEIPSTKIAHDLNGTAIHPTWEAGDEVEVVFGSTSEIFTLSSGEGTQKATFTNGSSTLTEGTEYAVYYPARAIDLSTQDGTLANLPEYLVKTGLNSLTASFTLEPQLTYFHVKLSTTPDDAVTEGKLHSRKVYFESLSSVKFYNKVSAAGVKSEGNIAVDYDAYFDENGTPTADLYIATMLEGATSGVSNAFGATFMNGDLANKAVVQNYELKWTPSSDYAAGEVYLTAAKPSAYNAGSLIGNADNSSGWWSAFSDYFNIPVGKKLTLTFANYNDGGANYHNWLSVITTDDVRGGGSYSEYFVLRSDNFGWGNGKYRKGVLESYFDWSSFMTGMNGAEVVLTIEHVDDGYALVDANVTASNGAAWWEKYYQSVSKTEDIRAFLSVENAHLRLQGVALEDSDKAITSISASAQAFVIGSAEYVTLSPEAVSVLAVFNDGDVIYLNREDYTATLTGGQTVYSTSASSYSNVCSVAYTTAASLDLNAAADLTISPSGHTLTNATLGATDNTAAWWTAFLDNDLFIANGSSETIGFNIVSSSKAENWDFTAAILRNGGKTEEYGVVRMDNYGWLGAKNTFENSAELGWTLSSNWDWGSFKDILVGSDVCMTVSNNLNTGKADIRFYVVKGTDAFFQYYDGIPVNGWDLNMNLTLQECYITLK